MKIKQDFVTNSSSTSFCAWGIVLNNDFNQLPYKVKKIIYEEYVEDGKKYDYKFVTFEEFNKNPSLYEWMEYLTYLFEENGLECSHGPEGCELMVGKHPDKMPDDMTLREFKNNIQKIFEDIGIPSRIYFIEEGWYDG